MRVALWSVPEGDLPEPPKRLEQRSESVERHLESWIEADPSLVMDGLRWVGRQVVFPDRTRLDLVGLTAEGQLVIAELKVGSVGIGTLAQALHYVLWIGALDDDALLGRLDLDRDQRTLLAESLEADALDVAILLVGTRRLPELDRAADFLAAQGLSVPVRIVSFTPFIHKDGGVLLARETAEHDDGTDETATKRSTRSARVEWVQQLARECGVGEVIDHGIRTAAELGLRVKPWPMSITIVPPYTRGRTLIYLAPKPGVITFGYSEENLVELYGAGTTQIRESLGENMVDLAPADTLARLGTFASLMTTLQHQQE